jgi:2'-5' RNA ligase
MRLFVAIFPPKELIKKIKKIIEEMQKLPMKAKFVEEQNLHISLSFLGERNQEQLEQINLLLEEYLKKWQEFEVFINGIKLIPSKSYFRVVALNITTKQLDLIGREISKMLDGDFKSAHLTLCRVKKVYDKPKIIEFAERTVLNQTFALKEISLVKSTLTRSGPIYQIIKNYKL